MGSSYGSSIITSGPVFTGAVFYRVLTGVSPALTSGPDAPAARVVVANNVQSSKFGLYTLDSKYPYIFSITYNTLFRQSSQ